MKTLVWRNPGLISSSDLRNAATSYRASFPNLGRFGLLSAVHALGCHVLGHYFGHDWIRLNLASGRVKFFRDFSSPESTRNHLTRVARLGEMMFNLQNFEGVDACFHRLRGAGDIESSYSELEAGMFLASRSVRFRYVRPKGRKKGEDYDIEIGLKDGTWAPAEVETKSEVNRHFRAASFKHSLDHARKQQLPEKRPGVLLVRVPPSWFVEAHFSNEFDRIVKAFLNGTTRVVSVIAWSSIETTKDGKTFREMRGRECVTSKADFGPPNSWRLMASQPETSHELPSWWIRFVNLFAPSLNHRFNPSAKPVVSK
jgi:hypothetical protein